MPNKRLSELTMWLIVLGVIGVPISILGIAHHLFRQTGDIALIASLYVGCIVLYFFRDRPPGDRSRRSH